MASNPLNDVRNVRRKISKECGNDPQKVFAFYLKHQEDARQSGRFRFVTSRIDDVHAAPATEQRIEPER